MSMNLLCWKCGASLADLPRPLSRLAECPKCRAYLHVCRMCEFYAPKLTSKCHEERAEEVRDKEHANFCDWFKARPNAHLPPSIEKTQAAKKKIDTLFGAAADSAEQPDMTRDKLNDLFGANTKSKK
ncbi:MAG: hypothetical protein HY081_04980 [Gammaproteobacteria bacterium]|nr:hypothetical protein [Gammaproteobacteria bacterium]